MEYWSIEIANKETVIAPSVRVLHYSTTPSLHYSVTPWRRERADINNMEWELSEPGFRGLNRESPLHSGIQANGRHCRGPQASIDK